MKPSTILPGLLLLLPTSSALAAGSSGGDGCCTAPGTALLQPGHDEGGRVALLAAAVETAPEQRGMMGVELDAEGGVSGTYDESPARKAGVKAGDRIVAIGGKKVASTEEIVAAMRGRKAGETIAVTLERDGWTKKVELTLAPHPEPRADEAPEAEDEPAGDVRSLFGVVEETAPEPESDDEGGRVLQRWNVARGESAAPKAEGERRVLVLKDGGTVETQTLGDGHAMVVRRGDGGEKQVRVEVEGDTLRLDVDGETRVIDLKGIESLRLPEGGKGLVQVHRKDGKTLAELLPHGVTVEVECDVDCDTDAEECCPDCADAHANTLFGGAEQGSGSAPGAKANGFRFFGGGDAEDGGDGPHVFHVFGPDGAAEHDVQVFVDPDGHGQPFVWSDGEAADGHVFEWRGDGEDGQAFQWRVEGPSGEWLDAFREAHPDLMKGQGGQAWRVRAPQGLRRMLGAQAESGASGAPRVERAREDLERLRSELTALRSELEQLRRELRAARRGR